MPSRCWCARAWSRHRTSSTAEPRPRPTRYLPTPPRCVMDLVHFMDRIHDTRMHWGPCVGGSGRAYRRCPRRRDRPGDRHRPARAACPLRARGRRGPTPGADGRWRSTHPADPLRPVDRPASGGCRALGGGNRHRGPARCRTRVDHRPVGRHRRVRTGPDKDSPCTSRCGSAARGWWGHSPTRSWMCRPSARCGAPTNLVRSTGCRRTGPCGSSVSRSRPPAGLSRLLEDVSVDLAEAGITSRGIEAANVGSVGAKLGEVMAGRAEAYLHPGGLNEWDLAAPHACALAAGLVTSGPEQPFNQMPPTAGPVLICHPDLAGAHHQLALTGARLPADPVERRWGWESLSWISLDFFLGFSSTLPSRALPGLTRPHGRWSPPMPPSRSLRRGWLGTAWSWPSRPQPARPRTSQRLPAA